MVTMYRFPLRQWTVYYTTDETSDDEVKMFDVYAGDIIDALDTAEDMLYDMEPVFQIRGCVDRTTFMPKPQPQPDYFDEMQEMDMEAWTRIVNRLKDSTESSTVTVLMPLPVEPNFTN